jgi:hypothetical protein
VNRLERKAARKAEWRLARRANRDLDGLVDKTNLVGDRVNVSVPKADDLERAEAWATLENVFSYPFRIQAEPLQEGTALRPFHKDPERPNYRKDNVLPEQAPPTLVTTTKFVSTPSAFFGTTTKSVMAEPIRIA